MIKFFRALLLPVSFLYGCIAAIRNILFDFQILPSKEFGVPIVSVGNLFVGGTGKSPHIEYLIELLKPEYKVSALSRGYGRLTKGFREVASSDTAIECGDEPKQFKLKFPELNIFVDENRVRGINTLLEQYPDTQAILLDDAYQHRSVKAGTNILLTTYQNLYVDDFPIPSGNLREFQYGSSRADIIVVTKTPEIFSPFEKKILIERLAPESYQKVYFSYYKYGDFVPLKGSANRAISKEYYFERNFNIVLLTGIANSSDLLYYIKTKVTDVTHFKFNDHHNFTLENVRELKKLFDNIAKDNKIVLTTEKDAVRLMNPEFQEILSQMTVFYIPIEVCFHGGDKEEFNNQIIRYVRSNQVNSKLH